MLPDDLADVTLRSLLVACTAMAFLLPVALLLGRALARRKPTPALALLDFVLLSPLVLPPSAVGIVLLHVLGGNGIVGRVLARLGIDLVFTWHAAAIASAVMAFPLVLRFVIVGFEAVDPELERVARTLGARRGAVFLRVTLPLALPGIAAGAIIGLARALSEFGATLVVAGDIPGRTRTLPLAIYSSWLSGDDAASLAYCAISLALAFGMVALFRRFERRLAERAP